MGVPVSDPNGSVRRTRGALLWAMILSFALLSTGLCWLGIATHAPEMFVLAAVALVPIVAGARGLRRPASQDGAELQGGARWTVSDRRRVRRFVLVAAITVDLVAVVVGVLVGGTERIVTPMVFLVVVVGVALLGRRWSGGG